MRKIFYLVVIVFCLGNMRLDAQSLAGYYNVTGYFFHPTLPRPENLRKTLTQINDSTYQANVGDLDDSYNYYFQFTVNAANQLVNWRPIGSTPADTTSGFMTTDNPGGFSYYPDTTTGYTSDVYNNTYDPATRTFYMHYGYNLGIASDTGQASYTRQIYEKWVAIPKPVINSFSPTSGTTGTQVTIKGSDFTNAFRVYFDGNPSDSFTVISDSEIIATVGGGRTGLISVYSLNDAQSGYTAYSADSFFYTAPVVHDTSWLAAGNKGFSAGSADYVSIAMDTAGLPYVVYQDKTLGNAAVVMHLDKDSTWKAVGSQASGGAASFTSIAIGSDNVPYVAYIDSVNLNGSSPGITVSKFSAGSWQIVGTPAVDTFNTYSYASNRVPLSLDSANQPYVLGAALTVFGYYSFYVHKYNGSNWETVGGSDIGIESGLGDASMAIDKLTNTVYVVSDNGGSEHYQGIVARYGSSGSWDTIPSGSITNNAVGVYYPDIAINKFGTPYISFQDDNGPEQVSVYELTGDHFSPYGKKYFSANHAYRVSLAISQSSVTPFVFYTDGSFNGSGTVMTPNINGDSSWQYLGSRGFAPSTTLSQNAIVTDKMGIPYVAFADSSNGYKATVLKYNGYDLFAPRTEPGLYAQGDSTTCTPWVKSYPDWTNYYSTDTAGQHIEMQTQFQDEPGNICGLESYIDSSSTYRKTVIDASDIILFPRNYRISFSNSPFAHNVGVRVFATTEEMNQLLAQADKSGFGSGHNTSNLVIYQYDGPNEDYLLSNDTFGYLRNADSNTYTSNFTSIYYPTVHYYGTNNEYCYIEFYTNHFSEFYIGIPTFGLLPVNLISFSATAQNHIANVAWQTTNEVNTSYFTVQRSLDGIHFTNIGKVNAASTSGNHNYTYNDDLSLLSGASTVYYRLQITNKDGSSTGSKVVSVNMSADKLITILPNPAHSFVTVTSSVAGSNITITDMSGRVLLQRKNIGNTEKINTSGLAKGVYSMRIDYTGGYAVRKFLVE